MDDSSPEVVATRIDGRTARRHRTRIAIVEAVISLLDEGDVTPTGARIAERAGVSLRSIGLHFDDREQLLEAVAAQRVGAVLATAVQIDPALPFAQRVDVFVEQRSVVLEALSTVSVASRIYEATSPALRRRRQGLLKIGRAEVRGVFELELQGADGVDEELLDAADVAAGWNTWSWLRAGGHDEASARRVLRRLLTALLEPR